MKRGGGVVRGVAILGVVLLPLVLAATACGQNPDHFVGTWRLPENDKPQLTIAETDQGYQLTLLAQPDFPPIPLVREGDSLVTSPDFEHPETVEGTDLKLQGFEVTIDPGASDDELQYSDDAGFDARFVRVDSSTSPPSAAD